jgi:hypothetical protein
MHERNQGGESAELFRALELALGGDEVNGCIVIGASAAERRTLGTYRLEVGLPG